MKKLKIMGILTEDSAVGFYRLWQPLKILEKLGLAELKFTPTFTWGRLKAEAEFFSSNNLKWFSDEIDHFRPDIIIAERHDWVRYIALLGALKNYDCPVVVDTDDDVQAIRPYNPGYASYSPHSLNPALNIKLMSMADAVTTSTSHLKEKTLFLNKNVYVVPNVIDIETRTFKPKKRKKRIRIGWLGSACHWENLQIVQEPVKKIIEKYPQTELVFTNLYGDIWANPPKEIAKRVIPSCMELGCKKYHNVCQKTYVTFDKYAKFINKLSIDIGLAPLCDNLFNRSKSNLRVLEYWADKIAVVASPIKPYAETIKPYANGLLAKEKEDWYKAIEKLVLDEKLRNKLKEGGFKTLKERYSAKKEALKTYQTYCQIIKNYANTKRT